MLRVLFDYLSPENVIKMNERNQLSCLVQQWNENRLDLFHLSYPTEDLEVEGVMRFYFQDGGEKVLTKCVRVSSTATTRAVVDALQEKFLPDLKMLSNDTYSLWEVHENGDERQLNEEEKPLLVQLMWHKDDREGRFLLRRDKTPPIPLTPIQLQEVDHRNNRFAKKKEKEPRKKHQKEFVHVNNGREPQSEDDIYKQVPFNNFTRTISNPEAVMRKRREKKLETKIKEMTYGGSLKVFGGEIVPSRPYVTILAGINDTASKILVDALEKYGLEKNAEEYILIEVTSDCDEPRRSLSDLRNVDGRPFAPNEYPILQMSKSGENGFESLLAIKKKPHDYQVPSTSVIPQPSIPLGSPVSMKMPTLTIVNTDGRLSTHRIGLNEGLTEVGSDRQMSNFSPHNIYLDGIQIRGRHAAITNMENVVTLTPSTSDAYLEVNGRQIMQTEILRDGDMVRIGEDNLFKFSTNQPQLQYSEMPDSRASTTRCAPSDYCSLPMNGMNDRYPPSVSGSSISSSRQGYDDIMNTNNNILPMVAKVEAINVPISIQIGDYNVWDFLGEVMSNRATSSSEFRLSSAYSLYLAVRFFHTHNKPYSVQFFSRIEANFRQIAQECSSRDDLIFWLANASEFQHLIERDAELKLARFEHGKLGIEIERLFKRLVAVVQSSVRPGAKAILDIHLNDQDSTRDVISLLDSSLRMARTCRLNPALTIQLCGHLLHMVNSFVFNNLVAVGFPPIPLTSRLGKCLRARLEMIHRFCEGMGVELAAECHLDRSRQASNLLAAQKNDVATLGSTCYKLNSVQVVHLLSSFEPIDGEIPCDDDVIDRIVRLAEKQADHLTMEDGNRVTLEEADDLNLPFLIPQDGYFIDQLKTVPDGLWQYLLQLQHRRLCHSVNKTSEPFTSAAYNNSSIHPSMTSSMSIIESNHENSSNQNHHHHQRDAPQPIVRSVSQTTLTSIPTTQFGDSFGSTSSDVVVRITLRKNGGGIGLSIVAAQGVGDRKMGIYVKKVMNGTPAAMDGRLETGDQLLSVNNHSLIGISQEEAAKLMTNSGNEVHFEVRKRAAHRNGLSAWLVANTPNTPSTSHPFTSPSSSELAQPAFPPPAYNNVSRISYEAPPSYNNRYTQQQQASVQPSRTSAFVAPNTSHIQQHYQHHNMHHTLAPIEDSVSNRHFRSSSASDLQQNDPNVSMSQLSITSSARSSVFDKLPSHYRHSTRPTVIQPARPGTQSPSSLRKTAPSPSNLYRPTSASNLFAPPRQSGALVGYSSNAARESTQDIHRALNDLEMASPLARSTPNEEDSRMMGYSSQNDHVNLQNYVPLHPMRPSSMYGYSSNQASPSSANNPTNVNSVPHSQSYSHTLSNSINNANNYGNLSRLDNTVSSTINNTSPRVNVTAGTITTTRMSSQEPAIVRPVELNMPGYSHQKTHSTSAATIKGAVPTAITQALQLQNNGGTTSGLKPIRPTSGLRERIQDKDVRMLEQTNIALMSYEAVNEELDRLDMKGHKMSEEETRRYRELLNVAAEQSRARRLLADIRPPIERDIPISVQRSPPRNVNNSAQSNGRIETVIDDVQHSGSSVENISPVSPPESRKVQFIDEITQHSSNTATLFASDVPLLDSPGIVGTNEIYRDPRQRRLNELQDRKNGENGADGAKLGFRDKQKLFARQIGEEGMPRQRVDASSAQRQIETELLQSQKP